MRRAWRQIVALLAFAPYGLYVAGLTQGLHLLGEHKAQPCSAHAHPDPALTDSSDSDTPFDSSSDSPDGECRVCEMLATTFAAETQFGDVLVGLGDLDSSEPAPAVHTPSFSGDFSPLSPRPPPAVA